MIAMELTTGAIDVSRVQQSILQLCTVNCVCLIDIAHEESYIFELMSIFIYIADQLDEINNGFCIKFMLTEQSICILGISVNMHTQYMP